MSTSTLPALYGTRIRARREAIGMTQAELARTIGAGQPAVANWEAGRYVPSDAYRAELAAALACTYGDLFDPEGPAQ